MQWLLHLAQGEPPGYADMGREIAGVAKLPKAITGQTVSAWGKRDYAPDGRTNGKALATYLGVSEGWLLDGEGDSPRQDLWEFWNRAREAQRDTAPGQIEPKAEVKRADAKKRSAAPRRPR